MEMKALFYRHAWDSPRVDHWLERVAGEPDRVRHFGPIGEMRGRFEPNPSYLPNRRFIMRPDIDAARDFYPNIFVPDSGGPDQAIAIPVVERGVWTDIVAFSKDSHRADTWGCVSRRGRLLNRQAITGFDLVKVYPSWWYWMREGCAGVLPLAYDALPQLRQAHALVVDDKHHARHLLFGVHILPAADPDAARLTGQEHIFIDDAESEAA